MRFGKFLPLKDNFSMRWSEGNQLRLSDQFYCSIFQLWKRWNMCEISWFLYKNSFWWEVLLRMPKWRFYVPIGPNCLEKWWSGLEIYMIVRPKSLYEKSTEFQKMFKWKCCANILKRSGSCMPSLFCNRGCKIRELSCGTLSCCSSWFRSEYICCIWASTKTKKLQKRRFRSSNLIPIMLKYWPQLNHSISNLLSK